MQTTYVAQDKTFNTSFTFGLNVNQCSLNGDKIDYKILQEKNNSGEEGLP